MREIKAVSAFIHEMEEGKYLLLKKKRPWIGWQFPQGKLEEGESEDNAINREIYEETGIEHIKFEKLPFVGGYNFVAGSETIHKDLVFYDVLVEPTDDIKLNNSEEEHSEFKWVDEDSVLELLEYEDQKESFRKFLSYKAKLPTKEECMQLLDEYHVPKHVIKHSTKVAEVAVKIANKLVEKGEYVNIDLVYTASILHDLLRVCDFKEMKDDLFEQVIMPEDEEKWKEIRTVYKNTHHADAAYKVLKNMGFKILANTIKRHKYIILKDRKEKPKSWEEKIVYYADKRVMHDKIVSLKKRFEDGRERNLHLSDTTLKESMAVEKLVDSLETEIFSKIDMKPEEL